jgi:uncharacterized Fe-S center protein
MADFFFETVAGKEKPYVESLRQLLGQFMSPFTSGDNVGIKLHWGERSNKGYLPPDYAKEIVAWLTAQGAKPFVFDTTVLYSGGRRTAEDSLNTAANHGYTADFLGCPVIIADGLEGRDVVSIPAGYKHFETVQVGSIFDKAKGTHGFSVWRIHQEYFHGFCLPRAETANAFRLSSCSETAEMHPLRRLRQYLSNKGSQYL